MVVVELNLGSQSEGIAGDVLALIHAQVEGRAGINVACQIQGDNLFPPAAPMPIANGGPTNFQVNDPC